MPSKPELVRALGAEPVVADALDAEAGGTAVSRGRARGDRSRADRRSRAALNLRQMDESFELTNRLRTEGTDHLLSAGRAVGVRTFVAQSFAGWPYAQGRRAGEERGGPARPGPAGARRGAASTAIRHLEEAVTGADWTEGSCFATAASTGPARAWRSPRRRADRADPASGNFPVVGDGAGVWSFVHIDDAAERHRRRARARHARHLQRRRRRAGAGARAGCQPLAAGARGQAARATCRAGSGGCWPARSRW